jgi:hypothetical protein
LRLGSTNPATTQSARSALEQLYSDTNLVSSALRALVTDRINHGDLLRAQNYATQLLTTAQVTFGDRLLYLSILKEHKSAALPEALKSVQQQSFTNALAASDVASWMIANGLLTDAARWLTNLPGNLQSQFPVQLALVNYYLAENDWSGLRSFTSKSDWGETDFLWSAFLSHAWRQLGETLVAEGEWHAAVAKAGAKFGALTALLDLTGRWKMDSERENLLWQIV